MKRRRIRAARSGGIFIDIDYFKQYNDAYGHAKGDEIIKKVAAACLNEESAAVKFARYGGDEFFGLALGHGDAALCGIAANVCANIRDSRTEHVGNPDCGRLTLSVGVVNIDMTDSGSSIIDVINNSDKALYHAKSSGKNAVYEYKCTNGTDPTYKKIEF